MQLDLKRKLPLCNILNILKLFIIALFAIAFFMNSVLSAQQTDPFYYKLLREGEKSFLARNYSEAVKELEIAAFGLHREKKLLGKVYVYLALCHYYLENVEKSKEYLTKVANIVSSDEVKSLDITSSAWSDFEKLLDIFKLGRGEIRKEFEREYPKVPTTPKPEVKPPEKKPPIVAARDLEKRIKTEPHNISLYYELYNFYRKERNIRAAIKLLEALVENNPNEINAYYLLAKIEFSQKMYQDALQKFNKFINPSDEFQIDNRLLLKSMIYISVCLYQLNQIEHLGSFVSLVEESTSENKLIQMLKEEGLEEEWRKIKRVKRRR